MKNCWGCAGVECRWRRACRSRADGAVEARVGLKNIRGVRKLLRKYSVDENFTRSGAIEAMRDVDPNTGAVGFDAFKGLHIERRRARS